MNELLKGRLKKQLTAEEEAREVEMARIRESLKDKRQQRVRLIQALHC